MVLWDGFEPPFLGSEPNVLPLDDQRKIKKILLNLFIAIT